MRRLANNRYPSVYALNKQRHLVFVCNMLKEHNKLVYYTIIVLPLRNRCAATRR